MTELERILQKCMDTEGYVLFVGYLSTKPRTDPKAELETSVQWEYRRFHFGIEDCIKGDECAIRQFEKMVKNDRDELIREMKEPGE